MTQVGTPNNATSNSGLGARAKKACCVYAGICRRLFKDYVLGKAQATKRRLGLCLGAARCLGVAGQACCARANQFQAYLRAGSKAAGRALLLSARVGRSRLHRYWLRYLSGRELVKQMLVRRYIHYFVHVDVKAKCPACGFRLKHKIYWDPNYKHLMHECEFCKALFAEKPLLGIAHWEVKQLPPMPKEESLTGMMRVVGGN